MREAGEVREAGRKGRWPATEAPEGPLSPASFPWEGTGEGSSSWLAMHNGAVPARGAFRILRAGRVIKVKGKVYWEREDGQVGGIKQEIRGWSAQSRRECFRTFAAIKWPERLTFLSLTYPGDISKSPKTGAEGQRDLKAFRRRWERRFGECVGAWKREFQRRGSLHYHLWLKTPEGVSHEEIRAFVHRAWNEIVAPGDVDHLFAGALVVEWEGDPAAYVLKEMGLGAKKKYQNEVPEWFQKPGRFWGLWGLKPEWEEVPATASEAVQVRRCLRRFLSSKGYKFRQRYPTQGITAVMGYRESVDKLLGVLGTLALCPTYWCPPPD